MHTKPTVSTVLLVGSGRLALHLKHWNSLLPQPNQLLEWNRTQNPELLQDFLKSATHVWLAISDAALEPFCKIHLSRKTARVVHFSGALHLAETACAHPLMSFPKTLLPDTVYAKIHFAVNGAENLESLLPGFNNKFSLLTPENKSFYHALCVLAGNFPQLLWNETSQQMKALGIPTEASDLYITQVTQNFVAQKENALTGPLVRKDNLTIEKNLSALSRFPRLKHLYSAFVQEFTE